MLHLMFKLHSVRISTVSVGLLGTAGNHLTVLIIYGPGLATIEKWAEFFCYTNSASNLVISSGLMVRGPLQVVASVIFHK